MAFLAALIIMVLGFLCIIYAYPVKQFTGSIGWFEKIFGLGGTTTGIKVFGILLIIGSFLWMTGTLPDIMRAIFGPLLGANRANS